MVRKNVPTGVKPWEVGKVSNLQRPPAKSVFPNLSTYLTVRSTSFIITAYRRCLVSKRLARKACCAIFRSMKTGQEILRFWHRNLSHRLWFCHLWSPEMYFVKPGVIGKSSGTRRCGVFIKVTRKWILNCIALLPGICFSESVQGPVKSSIIELSVKPFPVGPELQPSFDASSPPGCISKIMKFY